MNRSIAAMEKQELLLRHRCHDNDNENDNFNQATMKKVYSHKYVCKREEAM